MAEGSNSVFPAVSSFLFKIKNEKHESDTLNKTVDGPYANHFPENDSLYNWLCIDSSNMSKYDCDKCLGHNFTVGANKFR
ncbi:MAG: hypothetical protein HUJ51_05640 [Eggerthellaceae bacterium]|nr:hypothetical protein [Eggerthellaceae bacterium]